MDLTTNNHPKNELHHIHIISEEKIQKKEELKVYPKKDRQLRENKHLKNETT